MRDTVTTPTATTEPQENLTPPRKGKKLGILWFSNAAHAPTGYGDQTRRFTPMLKQAGYETAIFAFYGREGAAAVNQFGIEEFPRLVHKYGVDWIEQHYMYCQVKYPDIKWVVFSLIDPFALDPAVMGNVPWAAWVPVDAIPMKPGNAMALQTSRWTVAMSPFGKQELTRAGYEPMYCPHGIDTKKYKPIDRADARAYLSKILSQDLTGKFVVADVAANKGTPSRKNFDGMFEAFALFAKSHPDAVLYLHTEMTGLFNGEPLDYLAQAYDIADKVIFAPQYPMLAGGLGDTYMNAVYNTADVLFHPALAEGFGLPIVEAQAAGCPAITTDGSAMTALNFAGDEWLIPSIPISTPQPPAKHRLPLVPEAVKRLEMAYMVKDNEALRLKVHQGAQAYDVDAVFAKYMLPMFARIEKDLSETVRKEPPPSLRDTSPAGRGGKKSGRRKSERATALRAALKEPLLPPAAVGLNGNVALPKGIKPSV